MPKFSSLTKPILAEILKAHELEVNGTKVDMCERLISHLGADDVDPVVLRNILEAPAGDTQAQLKALQDTLAQVVGAVEKLSASNRLTSVVDNEVRLGARENTANHVSTQIETPLGATNMQNVQDVGMRAEITYGSRSSPTVNSSNTYQTAEGCMRTSLRDVVAVLPDFDPRKAHPTSRQFITRVENLTASYGWSEKVVLYAVQGALKGHAKTWIDAQDVFETWAQFVEAFQKDFPYVENTADIHIQMMKSNQVRNENLIDYFYKILALGRQGKLDDRSIIRHAINGIYDESVRKTLNAMQFTACSEFLKALTGIASTVKNQYDYSSRYVQREKDTPIKSDRSYGKDTTNNKPKGVICYNCNEPGHISVKCPKPQKRNRCPSCNRVDAANEPIDCGKRTVSSRRIRVGDHIFTKKIYVNNVEWKAFVDTGSQCSMVRRTVADKLSDQKENCSIIIQGIAGGQRDINEFIKTKLDIDGISVTANLYVVDDDVMIEDMLLGQDLFGDHQLKAVVEDGKIMFQVARVDAQCDPNVINPNCGHVSEADYTKLATLLNAYRDRFATGLGDVGKTDLVTMKIELDTDTPIAQPPYRVPYPKRIVVSEMVKELLDADIIRTSESEYASPITLVKKPDGSDRFCIDYRKINQHTRKEIYPTPNIEERLQDAKQFVTFTSLDLNSGYYQIEVEEESRRYTAFITTEGLYEFNRMPFGLRNAPMAFQRLMTKFKDMLPSDTMIHYMDDILIGANSNDEMFKKMEYVFDALRDAGLTLNSKKCSFFTKTITFLGHKLSAAGIEPGEIKTRAIANFKTPTTVTEVRRFLGLSGYFRKFVPGYSIISEPIRRLLKKDEPFRWSTEQEKAFEELKSTLANSPVLVAYDVSAKHQLHTDASSIGIAAVLIQDTLEGWKPVAYFSRSTNPHEKKMHSYELETLAVVEGLERFRYYIYGKLLTVVTDCSAVTAALTKKELVPRIARWWLRIQEFDLVLEHRAEARMCHVDALSRMPDEEPNIVEPATLRINRTNITEEDWLMTMQLQDADTRELIEKAQKGDKQTLKEFIVEHGRILKRMDGQKLYVVPKILRFQVVQNTHEKGGHLSVDRTIEKLQQVMWFPRMRNYVKSALKACVECAYNKNVAGKTEGEYHFTEMDIIPFKVVHVDHLGPFPRSAKRNEHIIVLVDAFTKFTFIRAVPSTSTKFVIRFLDDISAWVGMPEKLVSDRGTAFTAKDFKVYCQNHAIKHVLNAVRTPRANGQVERVNRTILSMLLPLTEKNNKWDDNVRTIQWSINSCKNATTKCSPHEVLFGYQPRDILANKLALVLHDLKDPPSTDNDRSKELKTTRTQVQKNIQQVREKAKKRYDQQHTTPKLYRCGDLVLVTNEAASIGSSRKLEPKYKGPFIITEVLGNDRYVVEDIPGTQRTQRHYRSVYASDAMKTWCVLPPEVLVPEDDISEGAEKEGWPNVTNTSDTTSDNTD